MVDSTTIATAFTPGTISTGRRLATAVGDVSCESGLVSKHEANDEGVQNGAAGEVSSEEAVGAGSHTSEWIGEEGPPTLSLGDLKQGNGLKRARSAQWKQQQQLMA